MVCLGVTCFDIADGLLGMTCFDIADGLLDVTYFDVKDVKAVYLIYLKHM